nr:alpha/beta hydrolase [Alteraurantiacibacter aestuarii]
MDPDTGEGRPVLLLHGLFSSAQMNWIRFGHAQMLADAGFSAIMPDLRAHGASAAPQDAAAYPPDVLVRDVQALVAALGLAEYDLAGFSLGGRTAAGSVIAGLRPRRLVLAGMGLESLDNWHARSTFFIDAIDRFDTVRSGDPAFFAVQFMKTMKIDRVAARLLLQSVQDMERADLASITMPTLVVCGEDDRDNGSPDALAAALPDAVLVKIPGDHMGSVTKPELGRAIVRSLSD